ncbi:nicotinamide mononucleotide transporter [Escherichia coli]|uniref:nicotinamide mononucleotide transporter n=1 Tax=Escherichia coli TaxID=562 RepID=UPI00132073D9|nr:nicotinamide mononucleotide transporter [Escherichia coli]
MYKSKYCFYIWTITNFAWCGIDFYYGLYSQSFLFLIYFILAIYGLIKWSKEK